MFSVSARNIKKKRIDRNTDRGLWHYGKYGFHKIIKHHSWYYNLVETTKVSAFYF